MHRSPSLLFALVMVGSGCADDDAAADDEAGTTGSPNGASTNDPATGTANGSAGSTTEPSTNNTGGSVAQCFEVTSEETCIETFYDLDDPDLPPMDVPCTWFSLPAYDGESCEPQTAGWCGTPGFALDGCPGTPPLESCPGTSSPEHQGLYWVMFDDGLIGVGEWSDSCLGPPGTPCDFDEASAAGDACRCHCGIEGGGSTGGSSTGTSGSTGTSDSTGTSGSTGTSDSG